VTTAAIPSVEDIRKARESCKDRKQKVQQRWAEVLLLHAGTRDGRPGNGELEIMLRGQVAERKKRLWEEVKRWGEELDREEAELEEEEREAVRCRVAVQEMTACLKEMDAVEAVALAG